MTVSVDMLATYLKLGDSIDNDRADLLLGLATAACLSIVNPLPDGSDGVVLDVAARAYTNPTQGQTQAPPPMGPGGGINIMGGLWLTKANIAQLRRLATGSGASGAFTIDPTPADAGAGNWWPQIPLDPARPYDNPPFYGDWDQIPGA